MRSSLRVMFLLAWSAPGMQDKPFRHGAFHRAGVKTAVRPHLPPKDARAPHASTSLARRRRVFTPRLKPQIVDHGIWGKSAASLRDEAFRNIPGCGSRSSSESQCNDAWPACHLPNRSRPRWTTSTVAQPVTAEVRITRETLKYKVCKESPGETAETPCLSGKPVCALYVPHNMEARAPLATMEKSS